MDAALAIEEESLSGRTSNTSANLESEPQTVVMGIEPNMKPASSRN
jgi:hypothetical protein